MRAESAPWPKNPPKYGSRVLCTVGVRCAIIGGVAARREAVLWPKGQRGPDDARGVAFWPEGQGALPLQPARAGPRARPGSSPDPPDRRPGDRCHSPVVASGVQHTREYCRRCPGSLCRPCLCAPPSRWQRSDLDPDPSDPCPASFASSSAEREGRFLAHSTTTRAGGELEVALRANDRHDRSSLRPNRTESWVPQRPPWAASRRGTEDRVWTPAKAPSAPPPKTRISQHRCGQRRPERGLPTLLRAVVRAGARGDGRRG